MIQYTPLEIIHLGSIPIQTWGLLVALGFLVGTLFSYFRAKKANINPDHILNLAFWSLLGGILGSRLLFVFGDLKYFLENPLEIFSLWHGGMSIFGGVLLAILFDLLYIKRKKLNFWQLADLVSPGFALGLAIGRAGCFLIHDHIGKVMQKPYFWGINYFGEIRHEVALYLILSNFLLFLVLLALPRYIRKEGLLFLIFLLWYSIARFFIDSLRDFEVRYYDLMISQWIAIVIVVLVVVCFLKNRLKKI
ncbi:MAG: prolipoprotein diacylglyceryl transferase [Patescibacteria group bacterium]